MDFGAELREARRVAGHTQAELASLAGISRQAVILLESGGGRISTLNAVLPFLRFRIAGLNGGKTISDQLGIARVRRGLTQSALATAAAVSVPTVRELERGGGSVASLMRVLDVLAPAARNRVHMRLHWSLKNDVRFTPPHILDDIKAVFGAISIDPCHDPRSYVAADRVITEAEDGLATRWSGRTAFVNPPYSDLTRWITRCHAAYVDEEVDILIGLFPARTETVVFRDLVFGIADVLLMKGKINFHNDQPERLPQAPFACMMPIYGGDRAIVAEFAARVGASVIWARQ